MLFKATLRTAPQRPARAWVLGLLAASLTLSACSALDGGAKQQREAYEAKLAKAKAIFAERCKTAGVVIHRTVKDVEGIELKKVRPELAYADKRYFDPMFEGAAMAGEAQGDSFIASFLYSEIRNLGQPDRRGLIQPLHVSAGPNQANPIRGYSYADVRSADGQVLRYHLDKSLSAERWRAQGWARDLIRTEWTGSTTRYAVDWVDLVDSNDRALWIAGTQIRVVDQYTGDVLAQLTRFVMDPGFGATGTGRWPWQHAESRLDQTCPALPGAMGNVTRFFVDTVLSPKQGD